jgi:aminoglycoside phosphotransferase family enzyme/predicted kinase
MPHRRTTTTAAPAAVEAAAWPASLLDTQAFPHPVRDFRLIETHISWVVLTGDWAYKIKKPLDLGFLDYSTLDLRRRACADELRLNARFAPQLYHAVVPITGTPQRPRIGGSGTVFEYAVQMRQFDQAQQLDRQLEAGSLPLKDMDALGDVIAALHQNAPPAGAELPYGWPAQVQAPVRDNFTALRAGADDDAALHAQLDTLAQWSEAQFRELTPLLQARREQGWVREVHGDLHLANLARLDDTLVPFDCIEFSAALRWNDVISDLAFLTMDLKFRGRVDLAYRVLNRYLEGTGDYAGLHLLRYYEVYRALVRAKVASLRSAQHSGPQRLADRAQCAAYVHLAMALAQTHAGGWVLMHGLSGCGKSWLSTRLLSALPAVRVRSDVERKRLHGLAVTARTGAAVDGGIYDSASSARTYAHLLQLAQQIVDAGENAIVDAAFLRAADRARFFEYAAARQLPCVLLTRPATPELLRARVAVRAARGDDASEAGLDVLERQLQRAEPLSATELATALCVPAERGDEVFESIRSELVRRLQLGRAATMPA